MHRFLSTKHLALSGVVVLLVLVVAGIGLFRIVPVQPRGTRVSEVMGLGPALHYGCCMAFSPDGKVLALPKTDDGRVELWTLETGKVEVLSSSFNRDAAAESVAFSDDGRLLAASYRRTGIALWDAVARRERAFIPVTPPNWVRDLAFSDGGHTLVTVLAGTFGELARKEHSVVRSDCSTGMKQAVHVLDPFVHFGDLSRDSRYAFFSKKEDQAVYDTVTGKKVFAVRAPGVFRFSADGSALVAYSGKEVRLWEVPSGKELRRFTFKSNYLVPGYDVGDCLSLSPDKKMLAIGFFTEVNLVGVISLVSGEVLDRFACCPSPMQCSTVLFSPDGRILVTDTYAHDTNDHAVQPLLRFWKIPASW